MVRCQSGIYDPATRGGMESKIFECADIDIGEIKMGNGKKRCEI